MLLHRVIPAEFSFVDQNCQGIGGECFGVRSDCKKGLIIDRLCFSLFTDPVTFAQQYLVPGYNRHRESRYLPSLSGLLDPAIQGVDLLGIEFESLCIGSFLQAHGIVLGVARMASHEC